MKTGKVNPDVIVSPNGGLQLTLSIDKINVGFGGHVKFEGKEATYEERRREASRDGQSLGFDECSRASFTVPLEAAPGWAIGSTVVLTIQKQAK